MVADNQRNHKVGSHDRVEKLDVRSTAASHVGSTVVGSLGDWGLSIFKNVQRFLLAEEYFT